MDSGSIRQEKKNTGQVLNNFLFILLEAVVCMFRNRKLPKKGPPERNVKKFWPLINRSRK